MVLEGRLRSIINSRQQSQSELIFTSARLHHALIDNSQQRKNSNMIHKGNLISLQCFPKNCLAAAVDGRKCLHATSPNGPFCMHYVDNVNYCSLIMVTFP